jgi:hypothetical protein
LRYRTARRMRMKDASGRVIATGFAVGLAAVQGTVPPLPAAERFVQETGLQVTLVPKSTTLRVAEDPQFRVKFENQGTSVLYVNPHVIPNLLIFRESGELVQGGASYVTERVALRAIRASDLVRLEPGRSWETGIPPERAEGGGGHRYAEHGVTKGSGWALTIPPGRYTARFRYISAPGHFAMYDPAEMPAGIWEGRLETAAVSFTVVAPSAEQLAQDIKRISNEFGRPSDPLVTVIALSPSQLIEEFRRRPESREAIVRAAAMHPPAVLQALREVNASLPDGRALHPAFERDGSRAPRRISW